MSTDNPMLQLCNARQQAIELGDANAKYCTMATIDPEDGMQVRTRTIVVRKIDEQSCLLFVNQTSKKNLATIAKTQVELLFFYPTLMQQFRLRGSLSFMPQEELARHWQNKPYEAKLLDHFYTEVGPQSSALTDQALLENHIARLKDKFPESSKVPYTDSALGLIITANYLECWQANNSGIHDRLLYKLNDQKWKKERLIP